MASWLYQMTQGDYEPEFYRADVWENEISTWLARRITRKAPQQGDPVPGDQIVFFYAKKGGKQAGIYGWAVITDWRRLDDATLIDFRPAAPSDQLKMYPWWDDAVEQLIKGVRKRIAQGTMFWIDDGTAAKLKAGILQWVYGSSAGGGGKGGPVAGSNT